MGFTDPWLPSSPAAQRPAVPVQVCRLGAGGAGDTDLSDPSPVVLPNVACLAVEEHEGPAPASATFRYKFDSRDPDGPQTVAAALSTASTSAHTVDVGDRIGVRARLPDGSWEWVFDGFPLQWSGRLDRSTSEVTFAAVGVAKRCWDTPVGGAVYRDGQEPEAVNDAPTDLVAMFNPKGAANASPSTADAGSDPDKYPVFLDPAVSGTDTDGKTYPRSWTLPMAVAYVLNTSNDQLWVTHQSRADLDALLVAREPNDGVPFDPTSPGTYTASDLTAPDTPLTGRPWPAVVHDLVKDYGFGTRFVLSTDGSGNPKTAFEVFLKQAPAAKSLLLQAPGSTFDPTLSNVGAADLARDLTGVVNRWEVVGALKRYEASFVLAPGFPSTSSDASSLSTFDSAADGFEDGSDADKYRLWVFDECGLGHYANASTSKVSGTPTSLDDLLGAAVAGVPQYATRPRPPVGALFTTAQDGRPLKYRLSISTDFAGTAPGLWDGTGTWQPVAGGFEILKDRLGIRVTARQPNGWNIGKSTVSGHPYPAGVVKAVEGIASPTTANPAFFLRLTCVVEGDTAVKGTADRASTSPLNPAITREVDARDRIRYEAIGKRSEFNNTSSPVTARDDTALAQAEAVASRTATEAGVFGGEVTIPRFTAGYEVGDRIDEVSGIGLPLRTDNGGTGYRPVLPNVVARRFDLDGVQSTTLTLSDAGLDRRRYGAKWAGRPKGIYTVAEAPGPNGGYS